MARAPRCLPPGLRLVVKLWGRRRLGKAPGRRLVPGLGRGARGGVGFRFSHRQGQGQEIMERSADGRGGEAGLAERLFPGDGELARLCRGKDWSATPLGPLRDWPPGLRALAATVVAAPTPMILLWGPRLAQIYNDGYREVMGDKHPGGLGQPTRDCWPEAWAFAGPVYQAVTARGEQFRFKDQRLTLYRHGREEDVYFDLQYGPARGDDGGIEGVLVSVLETTEAVLGRARTQRLNAELATTAHDADLDRRRLAAVLDVLPVAVWVADADGRIVRTNPAADRLWGGEAPASGGPQYYHE